MSLAEVLAVLAASYPRQAMPSVTVQAYVAALNDLPPAGVAAAVERLIKRSEWLPSIAEIRREYAEALCGLPAATEAWEAIQTVQGRRQAPVAVRRALAAVATPYDLRTSDRPLQLRRAFMDTYTSLREQEVRLVSEGGQVQLPPPDRRPQ